MPAHLEFDFASGRTGRVAASGPMRLLLELPYGKSRDPVEGFKF